MKVVIELSLKKFRKYRCFPSVTTDRFSALSHNKVYLYIPVRLFTSSNVFGPPFSRLRYSGSWCGRAMLFIQHWLYCRAYETFLQVEHNIARKLYWNSSTFISFTFLLVAVLSPSVAKMIASSMSLSRKLRVVVELSFFKFSFCAKSHLNLSQFIWAKDLTVIVRGFAVQRSQTI